MNVPNKAYWLIYGVISGALLLPMLVLGVKNPTALEPWLETGGVVESLPALVYLVVALLSALLAVKLALRASSPWRWELYSAFCFFLAGEEAEWGRESVLGWQMLRASEPDQAGDIHNLLATLLAQGLPSGVVYGAGSVILLAVGVLILRFNQGMRGRWLKKFRSLALTYQFAVTGVILLLFGLIDILQESFGLPYLPGQWSLEESFELLGSIALLFAILVKMLGSPRMAWKLDS
ncbi:MAG: hypothetical protein AAFV72_23320 [Cyanobacteria bacterium J06635_1]